MDDSNLERIIITHGRCKVDSDSFGNPTSSVFFLGRTLSHIKDFGLTIYRIFATIIKKLADSFTSFCSQVIDFIASKVDRILALEIDSIWKKFFPPPYTYLNFVSHNYCGAHKLNKIIQIPGVGMGIPNHNNDCFMNAVFQCLLSVNQTVPGSQLFSRSIIPQESSKKTNLVKTIEQKISILESHISNLKAMIQEMGSEDQSIDFGKKYEELERQAKESFNGERNKDRESLLIKIRILLNKAYFSIIDKENPSLFLTKINQQLRTILPIINKSMANGIQCDAHEYLLLVLQVLQCKEYNYRIQHHLKIDTQFEYTYDENKEDTKFTNLSARFPKEKPKTDLNLTKMALLSYPEERERFFLPDSLINVPENTFDHQKIMLSEESSNSHVDLPPFIPIQLARFSYQGYKIFNNVNFDPEIKIEIEGKTDKAVYKFNSVVLHYGDSIESGHYVAYSKKIINKKEEYILFNDEKVALCSGENSIKIVEEDIQKNGYLFFYIFDRIDTENQSGNLSMNHFEPENLHTGFLADT